MGKQILIWADKGGGGVCKPPFLADFIYEQLHTFFLVFFTKTVFRTARIRNDSLVRSTPCLIKTFSLRPCSGHPASLQDIYQISRWR